MWARLVALSLIAAACAVSAGVGAQTSTAIPLCQGLTIVTAVNQADGDYESIKTIESATDAAVRLKYSVERRVVDLLLGTEKQEKYTLFRTVRRADLQSATLYEQQFSTELPETIPETTAIGTSTAVLTALKTKGEAKLGIFIPYTQIKPPIDRNVHPNVYDNQMVATITRTGTGPVLLPVIVNDVPVKLPTIQATGDFFGDKSEFFFLDDPGNPLALMFRIGIGFIRPISPETLKACEQAKAKGLDPTRVGLVGCDRPNGADRDVLRVVKINYRCAEPAAQLAAGGGASAGRGAGGGAVAAASGLEQALAQKGTVDVYSIYFSFNSDAIRDESEPTLKEIADVLKRHADWKLRVAGHTDGIGTDQYNVDLSKRRAAAVKDALVKRYAIDPNRLTTNGFGKSQPKDTNDTLDGRARNRRVELTRL
jgi:outer membrane protein OmpA-like peptidoglycan-associated protein